MILTTLTESEPSKYYTKLQRNSAKFLIVALGLAAVTFIGIGMWASIELKDDTFTLLGIFDEVCLVLLICNNMKLAQKWLKSNSALQNAVSAANVYRDLVFNNVTELTNVTSPEFFQSFQVPASCHSSQLSRRL